MVWTIQRSIRRSRLVLVVPRVTVPTGRVERGPRAGEGSKAAMPAAYAAARAAAAVRTPVRSPGVESGPRAPGHGHPAVGARPRVPGRGGPVGGLTGHPGIP